MINRVIFEGNVYYKVADLADLFEVSVYKMRKAIKDADVGTTLKSEKAGVGFGRSVFVLEANVAKLNFDGVSKKVKTDIKESIEDFLEVREESKKKSKKVKISAVKNSNKSEKAVVEIIEPAPETVVTIEPTLEPIDLLQKEHAEVLERGKMLAFKLSQKHELGLRKCREIVESHLGNGANFTDATLDDIKPMRSIVAEMSKVYDELKVPVNVLA